MTSVASSMRWVENFPSPVRAATFSEAIIPCNMENHVDLPELGGPTKHSFFDLNGKLSFISSWYSLRRKRTRTSLSGKESSRPEMKLKKGGVAGICTSTMQF